MEDLIYHDSLRKRKKAWWKRLLIFLAWAVFAIVLFICGLMMSIVDILTPERLTPIVQTCASRYLNADVKLSRAELTIWHSFPNLMLDIDSLQVISHSLDQANDSIKACLPSYADTLLTLDKMHGGISVTAMLLGNIKLSNVELRHPAVNLVIVDDKTSNFDIMPESTDTTQTEMEMPNISINKFAITGGMPINYFSLQDSIDVGVMINTADLAGKDAPLYTIAFDSDISTPLLDFLNAEKLTFGLNGNIKWDQKKPMGIALDDFAVDVAFLHAKLELDADFTEDPLINALKVDLAPIAVSDVMEILPAEMLAGFEVAKTDAKIKMDMTLTKPYNLSSDMIPSVSANLSIPKCKISYDKYQVNNFDLDLSAEVNGKNLDASVIKLKKFDIDGMGLSTSVTCTLSSLISDPAVDGSITGKIDFDNLPEFITGAIEGKLSGSIVADTGFKGRKSYLDKNSFHKLHFDGSITLSNFDFLSADTSMHVYTHNAVLALGTNDSFERGEKSVDSLLTASITIDSCSMLQENMGMRMTQFKAAIGCSNQSSSRDSASINPIGGSIRMKLFDMVSIADSMRIGLRDVNCFATLKRFKQQAQVPELIMKLSTGVIGIGEKTSKMVVRDASIGMIASLRPKQQMPPKLKAAYDSLARKYPDISPDSIYTIVRNYGNSKRVSAKTIDSEIETLDFGVDNSFKTLLRRWNVHGSIKAKQGGLFTMFFPLRNRFENIDFTFTTDSIVLKDLSYRVGNSDFLVNGSVRNIKKALTSRQGAPLQINFEMRSNMIDVNQLASAAFAGASFSENASASDLSLGDVVDETQLEEAIAETADTTAIGALLIPKNLDASVRISAKNILYSDMALSDFKGGVFIHGGALNLRELSAKTDIGDLSLSALYTAPTKQEMRFGFGLKINNFYLDRFLSLIPELDSIMPLLNDIKGIINADLAATTDIDSAMNFVIPSLHAALKLEGDSLVLMDAETFHTISKWLLFKDKSKNMIDKMSVEMVIEDSQMELFPFMFDIDRYRLGVMGSNDLALNYDYHVSVLKSPIPFKFGINISGNMDKMKIRLGKAKFKEEMVGQRTALVDTTRINLLEQIETVFRRGVNAVKLQPLNIASHPQSMQSYGDVESDTISAADSLLFINEGLIEAPVVEATETQATGKKSKKSKS